MINMEGLSQKLKDALQLHIDRNELLKDSKYGQFALSDEKMLEELQDIYECKNCKTVYHKNCLLENIIQGNETCPVCRLKFT